MVKKFTIPFASQGDANDIPDALQVDGKVSFTQGFGYDYERPYDDPQAKDIAREDMNGLFKAITSAVGELQTLGASEWSNAISYPKGAIVYCEKDLYISQVDDNQNEPPQNWVSITSVENDSLKKAANLSDLTNKATARSNLGLGSSATLNKTDVLGTSTSLVATQKLVNDTKINLESSKQDKLTFVGSGKVLREGAGGLLGELVNISTKEEVDNFSEAYRASFFAGSLTSSQEIFPQTAAGIVVGSNFAYTNFLATGLVTNETYVYHKHTDTVATLYSNRNTTVDKSGFLRSSGSANALTEADAIPVGTIQPFVGETAPNDRWLLCRGQAFSAGSYPDLAQLLPDLKIPDLRGVALRGLDANRGFDPNRKLLSYQEDAMQQVKSTTNGLHAQVYSDTATGVVNWQKASNIKGAEADTSAGAILTFDLSKGARTSHETVMKNVAVNFIIKAR